LLLQDTSGTAAAQAKYTAAAAAAQQHANKVQQLLKTSSSTSGSSSSNVAAGAGCWQQVQTAAHHLLSTYRAANMRLQLLSSLLEGREQLLHQIQQAQVDTSHPQRQQQHSQQQHVSPTKHSNSSSGRVGRESASVLTAFELHLQASPQLLLQHQQALQQGCSLLQQQLQCVQAAQMFFAWASSVLDEQQKIPAPDSSAEGATATAANAPGSRHSQHKAALPTAVRQQQQQPGWLPEPKVADLLPLLQQLPAADSPLAAKVLLRVTQQLQAAATQAGIKLGPDTTGSAAAAAADALSALSLGSTAGLAGSSSSSRLASADVAFLSSFGKVAAAAMVVGGMVPSAEPALLQLPADIQQQLDSQTGLRRQQQQRRDAGRQEQVAGQLEQNWRRQQVSSEQLQELTAQLQQQGRVHGQGVCSTAVPNELLTGRLSSGQAAAAAAGAPHVAAAAEVQRLHRLALQVARQLAKTRAANKQQLQVAGQLLTGQGEAAAAAAGIADGAGQLLMFKT
jgi:hypothetical protein